MKTDTDHKHAPEDFDVLGKRVREALDALKLAEMRESEARRDVCECRNRLNDAQRQFDKRLEEFKKAAPRDSEWGPKPRMIAADA